MIIKGVLVHITIPSPLSSERSKKLLHSQTIPGVTKRGHDEEGSFSENVRRMVADDEQSVRKSFPVFYVFSKEALPRKGDHWWRMRVCSNIIRVGLLRFVQTVRLHH